MSQFALDHGERTSPTWIKVQKYLNERLDAKRKANDHPMDEAKRNQLIGRLAEIKNLIAVGTSQGPESAAADE